MINYCLEYCEAFVLVLYLFFHHCCSSEIFSRNKTSCCCCSLVTADTWNCKMYIAYATLTFVFSNLYISIYIYLYMYIYICALVVWRADVVLAQRKYTHYILIYVLANFIINTQIATYETKRDEMKCKPNVTNVSVCKIII